jgi:hypothetical protein
VSGTYDTVTGIAGTVRTLANGDLGLLVQFANPAATPAGPQRHRLCEQRHGRQQRACRPVPRALGAAGWQWRADRLGLRAADARTLCRCDADRHRNRAVAGGQCPTWARATGGPTHLFGFGQALGSLRQFASNEEQGVSHATINGFGALGGLAWRGGLCRLGLCRLDGSEQSIAALGASTKARGVVGGVAARFGGVTRITLSANYDNAHALTRRYVPDAGTISTSYALPSWSFDASISHALPLGRAGCCARRSAPPG